MSTPNPTAKEPSAALVAAAPALLQIVNALQTFRTNIGTNPLTAAANLPGAEAVLLGQIQLAFPELATAEFGVLSADAGAQLTSWGSALQALIPKS